MSRREFKPGDFQRNFWRVCPRTPPFDRHGLSATDRLAYIVIADRFPHSFEGREALAERVGCSTKSISRSTKKLAAAGLVGLSWKGAGRGRKYSFVTKPAAYAATIEKGTESPTKTSDDKSATIDEKGTESPLTRDTESPYQGHRVPLRQQSKIAKEEKREPEAAMMEGWENRLRNEFQNAPPAKLEHAIDRTRDVMGRVKAPEMQAEMQAQLDVMNDLQRKANGDDPDAVNETS